MSPADLLLELRTVAGDQDLDADGVTLLCERDLGTSTFDTDSDDDGVTDGDSDPDGDSVPSAIECDYGLNLGGPDYVTPSSGFVTLQGDPTEITISWDGNFADVTAPSSFRIHRKAVDGSDYRAFEVAGSQTSFTDTTAQPGVLYVYWVQAIEYLGNVSPFVNCSFIDPANPDAWLSGGRGSGPNFPFTAVLAGSDAYLGWNLADVDASVTEYRIWVSPGAAAFGSTTGFVQSSVLSGYDHDQHILTNLTSGLHSIRITTTWGGQDTDLATARQVIVDVP